MILLKKYSENFEKDYYKIVNAVVDVQLQKDIIESCKRYFPLKIFDNVENEFETLILLPYKELKEIYSYIINKTYLKMTTECFEVKEETEEKEQFKDIYKNIYRKLYDSYGKVANSQRNKVQTNVKIVKESNILTCPYCNRDYINCRGNHVSGAQLDHFYSHSKYPVFSVCLYKLVPVCGNCNRVKSSSDKNIISPFDDSVDFNGSIQFDYEFGNNQIVLSIVGTNGLENNITTMKIKEAYGIHNIDIEELIEKARIYNKTQEQELINTFEKLKVTFSHEEFKKLIFGTATNPEDFGRKPLSKLKYDILNKLEIKL